MATKRTVTLIDDIDGHSASETVSFGLDSVMYEIDLCSKNAVNLRRLVSDYAKYARKVAVNGKGKPKRVRTGESAEIRAWAKGAGYQVGRNGRVPADVLAAYAARKQPPESGPQSPAEPPAPAPAPSRAETATVPAEPATGSATAPASDTARVQFREPASPGPQSPAEPREHGSGRSHASPAASPAEPRRAPATADIRAWAKGEGIEIAVRGRIPAEIRTKYLAWLNKSFYDNV
jgi:Lsr2